MSSGEMEWADIFYSIGLSPSQRCTSRWSRLSDRRVQHLNLLQRLTIHDCGSAYQNTMKGLAKSQTITSTWNIEGLEPATRALLHVLCVLDSDRIPEEILTTALGKVDLPDYPQSKASYLDAREELIKSSLIVHNSDLSFLKIHRIVQDVVREKLSIDQLRDAYNAAVVLLSAVWPFLDNSNLNEIDRMRMVREYLPHIASLQGVIKDKTVRDLRPDVRAVALFNEASWFYILQPSGYGLRDGEQFAQLSQAVLESYEPEDVDARLFTKLLADCHRYQGITAVYKNDPEAAVTHCKAWMGILVHRIEVYDDKEDITTLPIAYNELGIALMRHGDVDEARKSWIISCETLKPNKPGDLIFPFPWAHRALLTAYIDGNGDAADALLAPILRLREEKLGIDDTKTLE